jgi:hypothetical protein
VTYGELLLAHDALSGVERALRECAQQIVGCRHLIGSLALDGRLDVDAVARLSSSIEGCASQLSGVRENVDAGLADIDAVTRAWVASVAHMGLAGEVRGR